MSVARAAAPAKINLGLFLGPLRARDARHEIVSVMQAISLADELTLQPAPPAAQADEIVCPGVPGPPEANLCGAALREFRAATGWRSPPLRLTVRKRIPVAAGLGGGSADAAATLRLAAETSGLADESLLGELAARLGADVPALVRPGRWLAGGAGERLHALPPPRVPFGVLVLPLAAALSTADVYARADELGLAREPAELARVHERLERALGGGEPLPHADLLHNDLQAAALSLCPPIADTLVQARAAGAQLAFVSGSGPTVIGLFAGADGAREARRAATTLARRVPAPLCATPLQAPADRADDGAVRNNLLQRE